MYLDSRLLIRLGGQFSAFNRCQPGNFLASGPTMRPLPPDFEYRFHSHRILHRAYTCQCIYKPWAQATVLAGQGGMHHPMRFRRVRFRGLRAPADRPHSGRHASPVLQHEQSTHTLAMHLLSSRARRVLRGSLCTSRHPNDSPAKADSAAQPEISDRVITACLDLLKR
jgi:hypothetical protein